MSAPATLGCAIAALVLGLPVLAASAHLEARQRAAGAADAAALAAADAATGWIAADPCALAADVARSAAAEIDACAVDGRSGEARVTVRVGTPIGPATVDARAAPEAPLGGEVVGVVGENGWAWPAAVRGVTQGHHDGLSIDLAVGGDGALYAPYDGVVVRSGPDGGGLHPACLANPSWWRGENHVVMLRHETEGRVLYSSHNHVAPGSPQSFGATVGTRVRAGQVVALAGMSGCTSGPHTHFTLSTRQTNAFSDIDPFAFLGPP